MIAESTVPGEGLENTSAASLLIDYRIDPPEMVN